MKNEGKNLMKTTQEETNSAPAHRRLRTGPAAQYCGQSKSTFEKARLSGRGPVFYKLGRSVVYDTRDLDSWMSAHRRMSTSDPGTQSAW